jgi:hypothetical protein
MQKGSPGKFFPHVIISFEICIVKLLTLKNNEIKNEKTYVVGKLSEICLGSTDRSGVTEYARQNCKICKLWLQNFVLQLWV